MSIDLQDIKLDNLQQWEKIELVLQRHWICLMYIFWYLIFLVISVLFILYFKESLILPKGFLDIILIFYISIFLLYIYIRWMSYELDLFIITNKRIISLEQISFLDRHFSECFFEKVQEVNAKTVWILPNLLNFWVVTIHTASEKSEFEMLFLPDPYENASKISNIASQYKKNGEIIIGN